jgi:isopenicillin-N epimerase
MKSLSRSLSGDIETARAKAASFLGADLDGFVFVPNATNGVNTVLASISLRPRDEVLITDQSYGAVKFAAERVCNSKRARLAVSQVPLPNRGSDELIEAVLSKVTLRTRLVIVDHIASPTGILFPIAKIIRELHSRNVPVLVDAAHAPGMVDVRLNNLDPDYWTGNFHKWCCAPRGSAGLWVREDHRKTVAPIITSWYLNEGYPSSFRWLGTDDYTPYLATPAAIDFMASLGWERVRNHNRALARYGRDVVTAALRTRHPVDPDLDEMFEAMTLIQLPESIAETEEKARSLQAGISDHLNVEAAPVAWNGNGYLRLSAQVYNASSEYEHLADGLPRLLSSKTTNQNSNRCSVKQPRTMKTG